MSDGEAITAEGLEALKAELAHLEGDARRQMAARIQAARELGDLKENAEYHIAKEDQAHLETKIKRLVERLRNAVVVDAPSDATVVSFGTTVTVADEETGREATYTLVGPTEADLSAGKLSAESPWPGRSWAAGRATRSRSRRRAACAASASCASAAEPRGSNVGPAPAGGGKTDVRRPVSRRGPRRPAGRARPRPGRRRRSRGAPGPRTTTAGWREALSRTRSAAAAASSAMAIAVARSSRPRESRAPAPVVEAARPAMPMATSHCPWRQARPKESAITTAGRSGRAARRARALASGSRGRSHERAVLGGVGGVDAGVGAHEAVMGAADEHAALRAQHGRRLVEDDLHVARVLGVLAGELPRAVADDDVLEAPQGALGLGDDLVGHHEHVARARSRRRAAARRGRRPGAPRAGPSSAHAQQLAHRRSRRASSPRVCAAPPVRASRRGAQDREVLGGVDVEHERARLGHAPARAAGAGRLLVALAAARGRSSGRSRRAARAAARWCPCRGGRGR
jgi:transcription elongation factor GreA